ncbi:g4587 [Coccomyxa elongata]
MASLLEHRSSQETTVSTSEHAEKTPKRILRTNSQLAAARSVLQEALLEAAASVRERRAKSLRLQRQGELVREHRQPETGQLPQPSPCHSPRG